MNCSDCGELISRYVGYKKTYECQICAKYFCLKCFDQLKKETVMNHVSIDQTSLLNEMNKPVESFFAKFREFTFYTKVHYD